MTSSLETAAEHLLQPVRRLKSVKFDVNERLSAKISDTPAAAKRAPRSRILNRIFGEHAKSVNLDPGSPYNEKPGTTTDASLLLLLERKKRLEKRHRQQDLEEILFEINRQAVAAECLAKRKPVIESQPPDSKTRSALQHDILRWCAHQRYLHNDSDNLVSDPHHQAISSSANEEYSSTLQLKRTLSSPYSRGDEVSEPDSVNPDQHLFDSTIPITDWNGALVMATLLEDPVDPVTRHRQECEQRWNPCVVLNPSSNFKKQDQQEPSKEESMLPLPQVEEVLKVIKSHGVAAAQPRTATTQAVCALFAYGQPQQRSQRLNVVAPILSRVSEPAQTKSYRAILEEKIALGEIDMTDPEIQKSVLSLFDEGTDTKLRRRRTTHHHRQNESPRSVSAPLDRGNSSAVGEKQRPASTASVSVLPVSTAGSTASVPSLPQRTVAVNAQSKNPSATTVKQGRGMEAVQSSVKESTKVAKIVPPKEKPRESSNQISRKRADDMESNKPTVQDQTTVPVVTEPKKQKAIEEKTKKQKANLSSQKAPSLKNKKTASSIASSQSSPTKDNDERIEYIGVMSEPGLETRAAESPDNVEPTQVYSESEETVAAVLASERVDRPIEETEEPERVTAKPEESEVNHGGEVEHQNAEQQKNDAETPANIVETHDDAQALDLEAPNHNTDVQNQQSSDSTVPVQLVTCEQLHVAEVSQQMHSDVEPDESNVSQEPKDEEKEEAEYEDEFESPDRADPQFEEIGKPEDEEYSDDDYAVDESKSPTKANHDVLDQPLDSTSPSQVADIAEGDAYANALSTALRKAMLKGKTSPRNTTPLVLLAPPPEYFQDQASGATSRCVSAEPQQRPDSKHRRFSRGGSGTTDPKPQYTAKDFFGDAGAEDTADASSYYVRPTSRASTDNRNRTPTTVTPVGESHEWSNTPTEECVGDDTRQTRKAKKDRKKKAKDNITGATVMMDQEFEEIDVGMPTKKKSGHRRKKSNSEAVEDEMQAPVSQKQGRGARTSQGFDL